MIQPTTNHLAVSDVTVKRVTRFEELVAHQADWERLADGNPFLSWDWVSSWWKNYGHTYELFVLVLTDGPQTIGFAPWFIESTLAGRQIRFIGSGRVCSDHLRILADDHDVACVSHAIVEQLIAFNRESPTDVSNRWDMLNFASIPAHDPSLVAIRNSFESQGYQSTIRNTSSCWQVPITDSWEHYLGQLSSKNRYRLRRARKDYVETGRAEFSYATTPEQLDEFYELFVNLHETRRESLGQEGCFSSPQFAQFLCEYTDVSFQQGDLLLSRLLIDGTPAAASLGFQRGGIHYLYQTGMNPDLIQHTPGWVMHVCNILHGYEVGLRGIDFLRGDERYKVRLGAEPTENIAMRITANRIRSRIGAMLLR